MAAAQRDDTTSDPALRSAETGEEGELAALAVLGRLAGYLAHDFNNLLTVIRGHAELLSAQLGEHPTAPNDLAGIETAVERATDLTRRMLALARGDTVELRALDVNRTVLEFGRLLDRLLGEHVSLTLLPAVEPAVARADEGQLAQVLLNLALNAHKAMPEGGSLVLEVRPVRAAGGDRRVEWVEIEVRDTGCGMTAAQLEGLFERPRNARSRGGGHGLGLAGTARVVRGMGGSIRCESTPGAGSSFFIRLAALETRPEPVAASKTRSTAPDVGGRETILLVEDAPTLRGLTRRMLERHGYTVLSAGDAAEARAALERHGAAVDLLLTDSVLSGGAGRSFAEELLQRWPATRVVYMSGYDPDLLAAQGSLPPEATFMAKPFRAETLLRFVRSALDAGGVGGASRPVPEGSGRDATPRGTVLVVDDDGDLLEVARRLLQGAGFTVLVAKDGAEALAIVKRQPVSVMLCDMLMPDKEGIETCTEMRRHHPEIPVVAMSGAIGASGHLRAAMKLGAVGSLPKPFSGRQLVDTIDAALRGAAST